MQKNIRTLEEKLSVLEEFNQTSKPYISAFEESIQRRRGKLSIVEALAGRVLAAKGYHERMREALTGADYQAAVRSISEMQDRVSNQRASVLREINEQDALRNRISMRLNELRYQYDHYPEETNGE